MCVCVCVCEYKSHFSISSSHIIRTYRNIFRNMVTSHTLSQNIYFLTSKNSGHPSHQLMAVKSKFV